MVSVDCARKKPTILIVLISRYFDAKNDDDLPVANCDDVAPNYYTSTVVSSIKWNALVRSAKAMAFNLEKLMSEQAQERLKLNFEK